MSEQNTDKRLRFTPEMKQELISRCQLSERLIEYGWLPGTTILDLGEDFLVYIYLNSEATGVSFQIQEKSTPDLPSYLLKNGTHLSYKFPVKDVKHWETFDLPLVLLIVWDVTLREGRWTFIDDVISDLDRRRPNWRGNKKNVNVHIPWNNTTDDTGLAKLKLSVGYRLFPVIVRDRSFELKVSLDFAESTDTDANLAAFNRLIKEGDEATFVGQTIRSLQFSDWFSKWFGKYDPDTVTLSIGSQPSPHSLSVAIHIINNDGQMASVSDISLKLVKQGTDLMYLTNEHQVHPIGLSLTIYKPEISNKRSLSCKMRSLGHDAHQALQILEFFRTLSAGGKCIITALEHDVNLSEFALTPGQFKSPSPESVRLVRRLCEIQSRVGIIIKVPNEGISEEEAQTIYKLEHVLKHGQVSAKYDRAEICCNKRTLEAALEGRRAGQRLYIRHMYESFSFDLLGYSIPVGQMIRIICAEIDIPDDEAEKIVVTLGPDDSADIDFINVEVNETFPEIVERLKNVVEEPSAV